MGSIRINGTSSGYVELQAPDVAGSTVVTLPTESTSLVNATPLGAVIPFAGSSAPQGWLMCEGQTVSRTDYAGLFAVIGTTYGSGDGATTFTLPNMKGRIPVGRDAAQTEFDALAETGGAKSVTLTSAQSGAPAHNHPHNISASGGGHVHRVSTEWGTTANLNITTPGAYNQVSDRYWYSMLTYAGDGAHTHTMSGGVNNNTAANAAEAHTNLQPYITLNYIIKAA